MVRVQLILKNGDTEGRTFLDVPAALGYILDTRYRSAHLWYNGTSVSDQAVAIGLERERQRRQERDEAAGTTASL
jgi:hypothetical protein